VILQCSFYRETSTVSDSARSGIVSRRFPLSSRFITPDFARSPHHPE